MTTAWPVEALVQRARQGDREAFTALHARFAAPIRRYLNYRLLNADLAEELAQDVWERAWRGLPATRSDTGPWFGAWLYRIANNRANDIARQACRVQWMPWDTYLLLPHPTKVAPDDPVRDVLRTEELAAVQAEVQRVLALLPPQYRRSLVLAEQLDSVSERMAEKLGLTPAAAKNQLTRARAAYRRAAALPVRCEPPPVAAPPPPPRFCGSVRHFRDGRLRAYRATAGLFGQPRGLGSFSTRDEALEAVDAERCRQEAASP